MNPSQSSARTNGIKAAARARRQAIKFLIELSQRNLQELLADDRPGDLLNVCADLCGLGFYRTMRPHDSKPEELIRIFRTNSELLGTLIGKLSELLDKAADSGVFRLDFVPDTYVLFDADYHWQGKDDQELKMHVVLDTPGTRAPRPHKRRPPGLWLQCSAGGVLLQASLYRAMAMLSSEEGAMVRRCFREACRRVFLAARPKQMFCRRQCASAAVFERFKQNLGKEAYAERRKAAREELKANKTMRRRPPYTKETR